MLHLCPKQCAKMHCDKHVVKMILEYAQILSVAHRVLDNNEDTRLMKKTHLHHPMMKWILLEKTNYEWLYQLFCACCDEYTRRYHKIHQKDTLLRQFLIVHPKNIPNNNNGEMTELPQCMPDYCKVPGDPVKGYRNYYIHEKGHIAKWKNTDKPSWWKEVKKEEGEKI